MLSYFEYLKQNFNFNLPAIIIIIIVVSQIVGEFLTLKGKIIPEIFTIRKYLSRRREERMAIHKLPEMMKEFHDLSETLTDFKALVQEWNGHYNADNISMRDNWMRGVDNKEHCLEEQSNNLEHQLEKLNDKIDKIGETVLHQSIEDKRNAIINFAQIVIDENAPVTREQFNRIFKIHKEYEEIIEENNETNGEVDISIHIIKESYESHMRNHTFIEEIRGYDNI